MSKCNTEATKQIRYTVIHCQWTYANYMFRQKCPLIGMTILFGICLPPNNQCFLFCGQANVTWTLCLVVSVFLSSFAANINIHVRRSYDAAAGHSQLRMMFGKDDLAIFNRTKRSKMRYRRYESDTLSTNLSDKLDEKRRFRCWKKTDLLDPSSWNVCHCLWFSWKFAVWHKFIYIYARSNGTP